MDHDILPDTQQAEAANAAGAADDPRIVQALEEFMAAVAAGVPLDRRTFLAAHAAIAGPLAKCLDGLELIAGAGPALRETTPAAAALAGPTVTAQPLGDYRLIHEIGRGGMGIVYEAEQLSLGRRVALKVLPFASTLDPRQLQRFKNESHAAAQLQHPNIVPVFATGCERGVHYYAMQLVGGQNLAECIAGLSRDRSAAAGRPADAHADTRAAPTTQAAGTPLGAPDFRTIAQIGIQAAEALEYAHQLGIVHRDIKPANLLIESAPSDAAAAHAAAPLRVWVTDFGLAQCQNQTGPTITGDLIGTLRYMSPEQALAQRGMLDHRTDVYSLGATLYELLTLEPPLCGQDRQELLRQIARDEPRPPRRLRPEIPAELETIVLKALEKNPADRYGSAQALADDLRRYLRDEPIRARRAGPWQRLRKWSRRHKAVVCSALAACIVSLAILAGSVGWAMRDRAAREEALDQTVARLLDSAEPLMEQEQWSEALAVVERADRLLASADRADRPARLRALQTDLLMAQRLEAINQEPNWERDGKAILAADGSQPPLPPDYFTEKDFFDGTRQDDQFATAFRGFGIDVETLSVSEAADRVGAQRIRAALVKALDEWAAMRKRAKGAGDAHWQKLVEIARQADPDAWRGRFRQALLRRDRPALESLADSVPIRNVPPATAYLLGHALKDMGAVDKAMAVLREAHRQHPDDFWLNDALGYFSRDACQPPRYGDALRYYTATVVLRPRNPRTHLSVALVLAQQNRVDEAIGEYTRVIELDPKCAVAWRNRASFCLRQADWDRVIADSSQAIALLPTDAKPSPFWARCWNFRGYAYLQRKQYQQAADNFTAAIERNGRDPLYWTNRGLTNLHLKEYDKALADLGEAIKLDPEYAAAWMNRSLVHVKLGQYDQAAAAMNRYVAIQAKALRGRGSSR